MARTGARMAILLLTICLVSICILSCSSKKEDASSVGGGATQTGNTPTATATKKPTSTPSPTPTSGPSGQIGDACGAFSFVSGLSGAAVAALPQGVSITGSSSPTSGLASDIADWFEGVLDEAFGGSPEAGCYFEAQAQERYGLWIAFSLSGSAPPDATTLLSAALSSAGANVVGSFSGQGDGSDFAWMMMQGSPVSDELEGGLIYIVGSEVVVVTGFGE